jgi:hypothetical protein
LYDENAAQLNTNDNHRVTLNVDHKIDSANSKAKSILYQMTYGQGQDLDTARDTAWGALNGMTYWQNHVAGSDGERGRKSDNDSRFEKVIFGKHTQDTNNATLLLSAIANTRA